MLANVLLAGRSVRRYLDQLTGISALYSSYCS